MNKICGDIAYQSKFIFLKIPLKYRNKWVHKIEWKMQGKLK